MTARTRKPVPVEADRQWVRPRKIAGKFGIDARTIRDWVNQGKIDGWKIGERILLVDPEQVAALVRPVPTVKR